MPERVVYAPEKLTSIVAAVRGVLLRMISHASAIWPLLTCVEGSIANSLNLTQR